MTISEPDFASFLNSFYDSTAGILSANTATNYIITPQMLRGTALVDTLQNTLAAFEQPIGKTLIMMEDDLCGMFQPKANKEHLPLAPFINDGKLHIRGMEAEKMLMLPLIMDFTKSQSDSDRIYYPSRSEDKLIPYLNATLKGIKEYYIERPDGLFEFYPFLGIATEKHSMEYIERILDENINKSFFVKNLEDLKIYCKECICFYSPSDIYDFNKLDKFAETVNAKKIVIKDAGHFTATTGYGEKFKEILPYIFSK